MSDLKCYECGSDMAVAPVIREVDIHPDVSAKADLLIHTCTECGEVSEAWPGHIVDCMKIKGYSKKVGDLYHVEMPSVGCITQGRTRADVLAMAADWLVCAAAHSKEGANAVAVWTGKNTFAVTTNFAAKVVQLVLHTKKP